MVEPETRNLPPPPIPISTNRWALFLDVDGTLLDFAPTPDAVIVSAALMNLLVRLQTRLDGALALISGREIASLDFLFNPLQLPSAGMHGFERRNAQGSLMRTAIDVEVLDQLQKSSNEIAACFPGLLVENKTFAVAFHFGAILPQQTRLHNALQEIAQQLQFELLPGRRVYELKPPIVNKGSALTAFLAEAPFAGRLPIFLGDDFTDEHALQAAREASGMAIQVGNRPVGAAQFGLSDPNAVLHWLQQWLERGPEQWEGQLP